MNNDDLLVRQQRLIALSAQLRVNLATEAQVLSKPLALVDKVQTSFQWLYSHPHWPLGILFAIAVLRPRGAIVWMSRMWWGWKTFKRLRHWMTSMLASQSSL